MPFEVSSPTEMLFFTIWISVGLIGLGVGIALVIRANRVFHRRVNTLDAALDSARRTEERSDATLVPAA